MRAYERITRSTICRTEIPNTSLCNIYVTYQTRKTVFDRICKHREES